MRNIAASFAGTQLCGHQYSQHKKHSPFQDIESSLTRKVQLTTDGPHSYLEAVADNLVCK